MRDIQLLHVDDDSADRDLTAIHLGRLANTISFHQAEQPVDALAMLAEQSFDCILSDFQMPEMNGLEFLKEVRSRGINTPFVFLTGQGNERLAAEAFHAGADDYFTKEESFAHYERIHNSIHRVVRERRQQQQSQLLEENLSAVIASSPLAIYTLDSDGTVLSWNPSAERMFGFSPEEAIGKPLPYISSDVRPAYERLLNRVLEGEILEGYKAIRYHKNGRAVPVSIFANLVHGINQGEKIVLAMVEDLSRQERTEAHLQSLRRLKSLLGTINQTIVRARSRKELFERVSACIAKEGNFESVLIGQPVDDGEALEITAFHSADNREKGQRKIVIQSNGPQRSPSARAFSTGKTTVVNDLLNDNNLKQWHSIARSSNIRSMAALPLKTEDTSSAVLSVYSREADFFDEEEIQLLDQIKDDISFALTSLHQRAERHRAQEDLKENLYRMEMTMDAARIATWDWHVPSGTVSMSPTYFTMVGYQPGELPQTFETWRSLVHPDDLQQVENTINSVISDSSSGDSWTVEFRFKRKDGSWHWIQGRAQILSRLPDGSPEQIIGIHLDIDKQKTAELDLEKSRRIYQQLFDQMQEGFSYNRIITGDDGKPVDFIFLEINDAFEKQSGLKREHLINRRAREVLPNLEQSWVDLYGKVALHGEPVEFQEYNSDSGRWYNVHAFQPEKGYFAFLFIDITQQKENEERISAERNQLKTFVDFISDPAYLTDSAGTVLLTNKAASDSLGYSQDELIGLSLFDIDKDVSPSEYQSLFKRFKPGDKFLREGVHRRKDGATLPVEIHGTVLDWNGGMAILASVRDITQHLVRKQQFETDITRLSQENKALSQFSYTVSHDLKAPLRRIKSWISLLKDAKENDDTAELSTMIDRINTDADIMHTIVRRLLELSRGLNNPLNRETFNLSASCRSICNLLAEQHDHEIEIDIEEGINLHADPVLMQLVIENILNNAVKYAPEAGKLHISISSQREDDTRTITFSDNGIGFKPEYAEKIFEEFFRLPEASRKPGSGIGLATVRRIVERHGGKARAEGSPGKGASIHLDFPLDQPDA